MFSAPPPHCMLITRRPKDDESAGKPKAPPPPRPTSSSPPAPSSPPTQSTASKIWEPAALALLSKRMPTIDSRLQTLRDRSLQVEVLDSDGDQHLAQLRYHY